MNISTMAETVKNATEFKGGTAVILGSGLGEFADHLENKKLISYIRSEKNSKKETVSSLCVQNGNSIKVAFETKDSIQSYLWGSNDKFIYVVTKEWDKNFIRITTNIMVENMNENIDRNSDPCHPRFVRRQNGFINICALMSQIIHGKSAGSLAPQGVSPKVSEIESKNDMVCQEIQLRFFLKIVRKNKSTFYISNFLREKSILVQSHQTFW